MMKLAGVLLSLSFLLSCATTTVNNKGLSVLTEEGYNEKVDKWTDRIEDYSGLNNTVTIAATLLNSEMVEAQLDQNARLFQWDQTRLDQERKDAEDRKNKQTDVFVSFYSPERKWDDLSKSKTLWRVFLDSNGQRYEGKAVKIKLLTREIQGLYPYHTPFATPYLITFPVPTRNVDGHPIRLIFTGSIGSVNLNFGNK